MALYNDVTLNINVQISSEYAAMFVAMLERIVYNGKYGHSEWVAFYSDGDGVCRPEITIEGLDDPELLKQLSQRGKQKKVFATCFDAS